MNDLVSRKYLLECIEEGWVMFDAERTVVEGEDKP